MRPTPRNPEQRPEGDPIGHRYAPGGWKRGPNGAARWVEGERYGGIHPYYCYGSSECIHCTKTVTAQHDPDLCERCNCDDTGHDDAL